MNNPYFQPVFLIAVPQLADPNFFHSVVLLLQHDAQGAVGLVLNHASSVSLEKFSSAEKLPFSEVYGKDPIYLGGPVERERGWILHEDESLEEKKEILPGLYLSVGSASLEKLLVQSQKNFKLFLGYSGWSAGQLEEEMKAGGWMMIPSAKHHILQTPPASLWKILLQELGIKDLSQIAMGGGFH